MSLDTKQINDAFCEEVGIKKICCALKNKDTGQIKYYVSPSGIYKIPKNWKEKDTQKIKLTTPIYPDVITNAKNFSLLLNVQWQMFGELGDVYTKTGVESFECNYVKTRLKALKMCRSFGGGEMFEQYKQNVINLPFEYDINK